MKCFNWFLLISVGILLSAMDSAHGNPPLSTPTPCPICPTPTTTCQISHPGPNESRLQIGTGDNSYIGVVQKYIGSDPCDSTEYQNEGLGVFGRSTGTIVVDKSAGDVDYYCDGSGTPASLQATHPPISRKEAKSYPVEGIVASALPKGGCPSNNDSCSAAVGTVSILDGQVTITGLQDKCRRVAPHQENTFKIQWEITKPEGNPCLPIKISSVTVKLYCANGTRTFTDNSGNTWSGSFSFDGTFDGGAEWDGYSMIFIRLGAIVPGVYMSSVGGCTYGQSAGVNVGYIIEPFCVCDCPEYRCGGNCAGSSCNPTSGMSTGNGDFSIFATPGTTGDSFVGVGSPFMSYSRETSFHVFGPDNPYAGMPFFSYLKPVYISQNQLNQQYLIAYGGGIYTTYLTPLTGSDNTIFLNKDRIESATIEDDGTGTKYCTLISQGREFTYTEPDFDTGQPGMLLKVKDVLDGKTLATYSYDSSPYWQLESITTDEGTTDLIWNNTDPDNPVLTEVRYPDKEGSQSYGTRQTFTYSSGTLNGTKYYYREASGVERFLKWVEWDEDAQGRAATVRSKDSGGNTLSETDYVYLNNLPSTQLDSYEVYGNPYDVQYLTTGETLLIYPDGGGGSPGSRKEFEYSKTGSVATETNSLLDNSGFLDLIYTQEINSDVDHNVTISTKDGLNNQTTYTYGFDIDPTTDEDYLTLLHQVTQPLNNYTEYTYDATQVVRVGQHSSAAGNPELAYTQYLYDATGRVTSTYTGTLTATTRTYENDNLRVITDGTGNQTFFDYNTEDQLAGVGNGWATTTFVYDSDGRRERTQSPTGIGTRYEYHGPTGKLLKVYNDVSNSSDFVTEYQYANSNFGDELEAVIDAEGHKTGYEYDAWGRLIKENLYTGTSSYTLADSITYSYDPNMGEYLDYKVDMEGQRTQYEYFAPGFLKKKTFYSDNGVTEWGTVEYDYYDNGALWKSTTTGGDCGCSATTRFYQYNNNGQIANHTSAFGGGFIFYNYDGIGRLDEIKIPDYAGNLLNRQASDMALHLAEVGR